MIFSPRAFSSAIRCVTLSSDGVPPKAGRPSTCDTTGARSRVTPATDQSRRMRRLDRRSRRRADRCNRPARRSVPNHATTSATRSRFGHTPCRSSSAASTSEAACATWRFSGAELPGAERLHHGRGLVAEFGGAGDQRHRAHHLFEPADRPHDLERELRNAVAEICQRQPLEHDVGEPAIGRRIARLPWRRSARPAPGPRVPRCRRGT